MAQKRIRVTRGQAQRIRQLERQLDDYTLRTLLSGSNQRLMRPERLANLKAGRGKLQPWESERLKLVQTNAPALARLKEGRENQPVLGSRKKAVSPQTKQLRINRALRQWVVRGKESDTPFHAQGIRDQKKQVKAVIALKFLGVEPNDKQAPYVRKVAI